MPCPHARQSDEPRERRAPSRRSFLKVAVSIGGASALSACLEREQNGATVTEPSFPQGEDPSTYPDQQHAWQDYLVHDRFGNTIFPLHQTLLLLRYTEDGPPTQADRERVEDAFRTLERAFQRGTGGAESARHTEGLLFTIGYSHRYFERVGDTLPNSAGMLTPEEVVEILGESGVTADTHHAVVHLASGYASVVLAAEQALFEEIDTVNGVEIEGGLADVFERADRRTGFIGKGQPAKRYDRSDITENAPLSMGFKAGFADNLPDEQRATIRDGPFAGGTTQQISRIEIDLDRWYEDHDKESQIKQVFTPAHTAEDVGEFGENLAGDTHKTPEDADRVETDARERGRVGHGQKLVAARDEDFKPRILRRDFNAGDFEGMHFDSWQRHIEDFVETRRAMDRPVEGVPDNQNGIVDYITVTNRATFLMPPRADRALPRVA